MTAHFKCPMVELKFDSTDSGQMAFSGYGAVFGNRDSYQDVIEHGAFKSFLADAKSGKQAWPAMLSQHGGLGLTPEALTPVGVWTDLSEDEIGLKASGVFADTPRGRELYTLMKMQPRPAIDGLSIGYIAREWESGKNKGDPARRLKRIDLAEISPVTFPANGLARVSSVKSIEDLSNIREIEEYMSEFGLSKKQTVALISRIKGIGSGDPVDVLGGPGDPVATLREDVLSRVIQTLRP